MRNAVIVDAIRTPTGRRNGGLAGWHPADLSALVLQQLVSRNSLDSAQVDDVIWGCGSQVGEQAGNIGRYAALSAGFADTVPGTTVQRQCGSSQQAIHFAAQGVIAGAYDIVIAGGVESMTRVPMGSSTANGPGQPSGQFLTARYRHPARLVQPGVAADELAAAYGLSREAMDAYSLRSHLAAAAARREGRFDAELIDVPPHDGSPGITVDEGIREQSTLESLAGLSPAFGSTGSVTAGSSSQIADGAAGMLIMSEAHAIRLGRRPRARFHAFAVVGDDPVAMLTAPISATRTVLQRGGLRLGDMDVIEINEAFASVVLAWASALGPDMERVNPNGGAIALGHPVGASGARLMATLLNELERTSARWGLQTMCEGGGTANATIIERLD